MPSKVAKNTEANSTRVSVREEMMLPRTARSARVAALNLDATRNPEPPSTTVSGTVEKIIPAKSSGKPEKAQISVDRTEKSRRNLRINNELTDEHGDDVKLKKGSHVEVTVAAEPKHSTAPAEPERRPVRRKPAGHDSRRRKS